MEVENKPKNYSLIIKVAVFGVALIITGTIVFQGNFLEGLLKLIGAGASETEEIVISTIDEFMGETGDWWVNDSVVLENTEVVSYVPNQPEDPTLIGFLIPSVEAPTTEDSNLLNDEEEQKTSELVETEKEYSYISPIIDLEGGSTLRSITTLDYRPLGSEIVYAYRTGTTASLSGAFIPIEDTSTSNRYPNSQFIEHQAQLELSISRYLQLEVTFLNVNPKNLAVVAEIRVAYQPETEKAQINPTASWGDFVKGNPQIAKEIIIDYNELTVLNDEPGSVRINAAADGRKVARLDEIILSKRQRVRFEDVELLTGEEYVVVLETPGMDRKVLYFAASYEPEANYEFTFGALYPKTSDNASDPFTSSADLNGDGSVNSIDYQMFLEQFGKTNTTQLDF